MKCNVKYDKRRPLLIPTIIYPLSTSTPTPNKNYSATPASTAPQDAWHSPTASSAGSDSSTPSPASPDSSATDSAMAVPVLAVSQFSHSAARCCSSFWGWAAFLLLWRYRCLFGRGSARGPLLVVGGVGGEFAVVGGQRSLFLGLVPLLVCHATGSTALEEGGRFAAGVFAWAVRG